MRANDRISQRWQQTWGAFWDAFSICGNKIGLGSLGGLCSLLSLPGFRDSVFLFWAMSLSIVYYLPNLGFYSDDWAFLATLHFYKDQSLIGLVRSFYTSPHAFWPRPVQAAYLSFQYWLFGLAPTGYHLLNSIVFMSGVLLFYWVLRHLQENRWIALTVPLVYGLLPHYSTDRFWYACSVANLSMALYFSSLFCDLRMLEARPRVLWIWKLLALFALLGSALAYEVFLPLLVLNPPLVLLRRRKLSRSSQGTPVGQRKALVLLGMNLLALMLVVVFKKMTSDRAPGSGLFSTWIIKQFIAASVDLNCGQYGSGLPRVLWRIIFDYQDPVMFVLTGVFALTVLIYFHRLASRSEVDLPRITSMITLLSLGLFVSGSSYAYFYRNYGVTTGINNRVAIAAAVGVALAWVGASGWTSNLLNSSRSRKRMFSLLIAILCSSGFLINNTIASFWVAAYRQQQEITADLRQQLPVLPAGSTLILDGFCLYLGPGIVLETNWDAEGLLRLASDDESQKADVVKPSLKIGENGVYLSLYSAESYYPYGRLQVYNHSRKIIIQLENADAAYRYFSAFNPWNGGDCPPGKEGVGTKIF